MSKTKLDIMFNITNYGLDPKITMRALLRKANSTHKKGSISGALIVKPRHEIARYETFQMICAQYNKLDELDNAANEARGSIKLVIENIPAELVHAKRKNDDTEYDAILVNFGTEEAPHVRAFYLSDMQSQLIRNKQFVPQAEFSVALDSFEDDDDLSEENE